MYGKTSVDVARTLNQMIDEARVQCRYNQDAIVTKVAEFVRQDRRFDSIADPAALAREALDCRKHGRVLDLTPRLRLSGGTVNSV
jgi:hypothetical protein